MIKYEELKELIKPYDEDFVFFGQPDLKWLREVRDKFEELDELIK